MYKPSFLYNLEISRFQMVHPISEWFKLFLSFNHCFERRELYCNFVSLILCSETGCARKASSVASIHFELVIDHV